MRCLLLFAPIAILLICGCSKTMTSTSHFIGFSVRNDIDTASSPVDDTFPGIPAKAYGIHAVYLVKVVGSAGSNNGGHDVEYIVNNNISVLNIFSTSYFDAAHPALASLNDVFNIMSDTFGYHVSPISATNIGIPNTTISYDTPHNTGDTMRNDYYFMLMKQPADLGQRTFIIQITCSDSSKFTDSVSVNLL